MFQPRKGAYLNISKQTCKFIFSSAFVISYITEFQNFKTQAPGPDLIQMVSKSLIFIVRLYWVA